MSSNFSIIGGTGFIGKHLVDHLIYQEVNSIQVLTRTSNVSNKSNLKYVKGNFLLPETISNFINKQDIVINLAYIDQNYKANMDLINKLIESSLNSGVSKFIHCSSAVVAGRVDIPIITEDTPCNPLSEYEKTKLAIEERLLEKLKGKIELIIIRPTFVFGDGGKNLLKTIHSQSNNSRIINIASVMLNKYRKIHLVPVNDVVNAIYYLASTNINLSGEKFIISKDHDLENNYFSIVNKIAFKIGSKRYYKVFFPFSTLILMLILKLIGRTQLLPDQIYSSNKLYDYGFKSNTNLLDSIDKFIDCRTK